MIDKIWIRIYKRYAGILKLFIFIYFLLYRKDWKICGAQNALSEITRKCLSSVLAQDQRSR